jgi:hypothetical protein
MGDKSPKNNAKSKKQKTVKKSAATAAKTVVMDDKATAKAR